MEGKLPMADAPMQDQLVDLLLAETVGRIFVHNLMDHVRLGHVRAKHLSQAWTAAVHEAGIEAGIPPQGAEEAINAITRQTIRPPSLGLALARVPGLRRPPELRRWRNTILCNAMPARRLVYMNGVSGLLGTNTSRLNPTKPAERQVVWLTTKTENILRGDPDSIRDLLGLVHYCRSSPSHDEIALRFFHGSNFEGLSRPTALNGGANKRFLALTARERPIVATSSRRRLPMGMTANLQRVREKSIPFDGAPEAVAFADAATLARYAEPIVRVGKITRLRARDDAKDRAFESYLASGRTKRDMRTFLNSMYSP